VLSIDVSAGKVRAQVQGSRPTPYSVTIELRPLEDAQWQRVIDALAEQAIFAAQLLAGEMPQDVEQVFDAARAPLFPRSARDIRTDCSCPDSANPCKHIAAVHYLLGERFDEDPFLLFELRGRTRDQVVEALRARRADSAGGSDSKESHHIEPVPSLAEQLSGFYQAGAELESLDVQIAAPEIEAALLRRLGPAPAGGDDALRAIYRRVSERAIERVVGTEE
jgi:uncharacterized Zn finger protein